MIAGKLTQAFIFTNMGSKPFQFKKFSIAQDRCTHKVGTDGVLLGAWVHIGETDKSMLDIGTGSGLIAIMFAQRASPEAHIDAVELEAQDVQQARENVRRSPWPEKVNIHHTPLQQFFPGKQYDLIVSNPPYFVRSLLPPDEKRTQARHAHALSFSELLENTTRLLAPGGRLGVILPYAESREFTARALDSDLFIRRQAVFRARPHKPPERLLMEFSLKKQNPEQREIILYEAGDQWSADYKSLTGDFYLRA